MNPAQVRNSGDFDAYCNTVLPRLIRVACSITTNRHDAEDVAIETLARAHLHWRRLERAEWRDAWVIKVASRLAIDQLRSRARQANPEPVPVSSPTQNVDDRELLVPALRELPRRQQQAVVLYYIGDLSYQEIARVQRISVGSVKTHLHRALESLRSKVDVSSLEENNHAQRRPAT